MRLGEVVQLGQHRLCCGDAGNPEHVAALLGAEKPDLVFTSPPYLQQRTYGQAITCWDTLMQRVFGAMPHHEKTQVLVNLGLVHRDGEWLPYWDGWMEWMRAQGWRRFGWYVWDKREGLPGDFRGRPCPSFEWIFHFNRLSRPVNKYVRCKNAGLYRMDGTDPLHRASKNRRKLSHNERPVADFKAPRDVWSVFRENLNRTGHPAVFPVALPTAIHAAYTDPGELVYDPFAGSGTSIIAAMQGGRRCYGMECNPKYCRIALERIAALTPKQLALFG